MMQATANQSLIETVPFDEKHPAVKGLFELLDPDDYSREILKTDELGITIAFTLKNHEAKKSFLKQCAKHGYLAIDTDYDEHVKTSTTCLVLAPLPGDSFGGDMEMLEDTKPPFETIKEHLTLQEKIEVVRGLLFLFTCHPAIMYHKPRLRPRMSVRSYREVNSDLKYFKMSFAGAAQMNVFKSVVYKTKLLKHLISFGHKDDFYVLLHSTLISRAGDSIKLAVDTIRKDCEIVNVRVKKFVPSHIECDTSQFHAIVPTKQNGKAGINSINQKKHKDGLMAEELPDNKSDQSIGFIIFVKGALNYFANQLSSIEARLETDDDDRVLIVDWEADFPVLQKTQQSKKIENNSNDQKMKTTVTWEQVVEFLNKRPDVGVFRQPSKLKGGWQMRLQCQDSKQAASIQKAFIKEFGEDITINRKHGNKMITIPVSDEGPIPAHLKREPLSGGRGGKKSVGKKPSSKTGPKKTKVTLSKRTEKISKPTNVQQLITEFADKLQSLGQPNGKLLKELTDKYYLIPKEGEIQIKNDQMNFRTKASAITGGTVSLSALKKDFGGE